MTGLSVTTPPLKELFPVGSIYINVNTTNPGTIFGGTWEQIKDKFLLCSGSTYSNGSSGGSTSHLHGTQGHVLTVNEMPQHTHGMTLTSYNNYDYSGGFNWAYGINNSGYFKSGSAYILYEGGSQ